MKIVKSIWKPNQLQVSEFDSHTHMLAIAELMENHNDVNSTEVRTPALNSVGTVFINCKPGKRDEIAAIIKT